jgi:hypothetical protein
MANNKKNTNPDRPPSVGTLALVETKTGLLRIHLDFSLQEGTDPMIARRLQASVAGLSYIYERDTANVESIGIAYLDGIEEGIKQIKLADKKKNSNKNYQDSKIGFHGKMKEDDENE